MPTLTTNLLLVKPAGSDDALISVINDNMDILDSAATLAGTQTLTNKILTSPHFTAAVVDAGGLTVTSGDLVVATGLLSFGATAGQIVGGSTSFAVRNHASTADNLLITDAGVATIRAGLTITAGNVGVGGAPAATAGVSVVSTALTGATQYGVRSAPVASSAASGGSVYAFSAVPTTSSGLAVGIAAGYYASTPVLGGGGAEITSAYGILIDTITTGTTNNYGIFIAPPSGGSTLNVGLNNQGSSVVNGNGQTLGFFGNIGAGRGTVTGSRGGNAALASLLTILAAYNILNDSSTA